MLLCVTVIEAVRYVVFNSLEILQYGEHPSETAGFEAPRFDDSMVNESEAKPRTAESSVIWIDEPIDLHLNGTEGHWSTFTPALLRGNKDGCGTCGLAEATELAGQSLDTVFACTVLVAERPANEEVTLDPIADLGW